MIFNKRHVKFVLPIILFAIVIGCAYNCNLKDKTKEKTVFAKNNELKKETEFNSIEKKDVKSINNEHTKIQKDNTKEVEVQDNKNSSKGQSKHINKQINNGQAKNSSFKGNNTIALSYNPVVNNSHEIDKKIYGLKYDPRNILTYNGESVENFIPNEGFDLPNKYIVVKREKKSISDSTADISVIDSINDRTYPGAIQLANRNLMENKPNIISCERKPITISVDLPGMSDDGRKIVQAPTYSSVNSAINSLLDTWNNKYSSKYTIPTRISYADTMVYSKSQLSTMFGCNFKMLNKSLNIDFDSIFKGEKQVMLLSYKQIFYTVSVDPPNNPSDLFGENVTANELIRKGINKNNPPTYVSNVAYGRTIYVKLETTSKSSKVKAAFKALINNQDVSNNTEYKDILSQSSFTATVLGGGAKEHIKVVAKDFNEIRNIIKENSVYSSQNPGYPISYTTSFLKDNSIATVNNKTDYIETTSTEYTSGKIVLDHSGAYVAQFQVTWDEVNYDENGKETLTHKSWSGNNLDRTAHFNTEIYLKGNCKNICIKARECTGLAWEWWRTIIDEKNVPLVKERTISIWGTTLYPKTSNIIGM